LTPWTRIDLARAQGFGDDAAAFPYHQAAKEASMRIFISAGEPSGDLHGANLVRALRRQHAGAEFVGFGGERMQAAGCQLLYPLCRLAVMWFLRVLAHAPTFLDLLSRADRYFRHHRPDAVVLIDYPGFNWWIARRARFHGIPVFYFVPPQLWAWAGWRVEKMRRFVDHVLCSLPFEQDWYVQRGVTAHYVGHPYFDELPAQQLDEEFLELQSRGGLVVALLPGSRNQEVTRNLPMLVESAARIHRARPDVRFLVANYKESQRQTTAAYLRGRGLPVETHVERTPEIIRLARACVAVSGSVGMELLYHGTPSVVVYKVSPFDLWVCGKLKTAPYISLVNLLAEKELFPEFLTDHCRAEEIAGHVLGWLNDEGRYAALRDELAAMRRRVAQPGACERTAGYILENLCFATRGLATPLAA
jgi:lipid-A-disaccharide synthase